MYLQTKYEFEFEYEYEYEHICKFRLNYNEKMSLTSWVQHDEERCNIV